jgi:EmrB/QacA subfamily drug resistance transporter
MSDPVTASRDGTVRYGTRTGRWVLLTTIAGAGIAFLDGTVINVALPALGEELGADVADLQWILNGYLLALASLILLGGSLGDRYGRRRVFLLGVVWFAVASLLCGLAPTTELLIAARVLQGIGGALLTPGSLAIIEAVFHPDDRGRAIGAWSGLTGIATAIGPLLGGYLVDAVNWRWIFLINLPFAVLVIYAARHVPETSNPSSVGRLDVGGALTGAVGLGGITYALIQLGDAGVTAPVVGAGVLGVAALVLFAFVERRERHPMLPLAIFSSSQFTWANVVTFLVYGAFGSVFFLLTVQLQQVLGYSALEAGMAALPVTLLMLVLSPRAGALSQRIGPRLPMSVGPVLMGLAVALFARIQDGASYVNAVLPAVIVFGIGLSITVAPLTTTVLAAAPREHVGVASGVNNAVSRAGQLIAVALIPVLAGLTGGTYQDPELFSAGFQTATYISAGILFLGGLLAWFTIDPGVGRQQTGRRERHDVHCSVQGPPLRSAPR